MNVTRWTPLIMVAPGRYLDRGSFWESFDFETWATETYSWTQDPWNGFLDVAGHPRETVASGTGDCEDFALVAASWANAQGRRDIGLGFCWQRPYPWPRHAIAFDSERVYSSGRIIDGSPNAYLTESPYGYCLRRGLSTSAIGHASPQRTGEP